MSDFTPTATGEINFQSQNEGSGKLDKSGQLKPSMTISVSAPDSLSNTVQNLGGAN